MSARIDAAALLREAAEIFDALPCHPKGGYLRDRIEAFLAAPGAEAAAPAENPCDRFFPALADSGYCARCRMHGSEHVAAPAAQPEAAAVPAGTEWIATLAAWHRALSWDRECDSTTVCGRDGVNRWVSHRETAEKLEALAAAHTAPAVASGKHFDTVLRITTAYEQGFGHALRTELSNPYRAGTQEHEAWDHGREVGARRQTAPAVPSDAEIRAAWQHVQDTAMREPGEPAIRLVRKLLGAAPSVPTEPGLWAEYVAGMVVAYLGGPVDDPRIKPIAGIIQRRMVAAAPAVQVPPMLTPEQMDDTMDRLGRESGYRQFAHAIIAERDKQWIAACGVKS